MLAWDLKCSENYFLSFKKHIQLSVTFVLKNVSHEAFVYVTVHFIREAYILPVYDEYNKSRVNKPCTVQLSAINEYSFVTTSMLSLKRVPVLE